MSNEKKYDLTELAIFFPSVVALAFIPILMHVNQVVSDLPETARLFQGTINESGQHVMIDSFSQGKAYAVVVFAIIMLAVAAACSFFLFKRAEKRSLAIVGASVVYVVMALISACLSDYKEIAFYGVYDRAEGFFTTACYFVIFLFTMYAFRTEQNFRPIVIALFVCVGVNAIVGAFQITGNNLINYEWFDRLVVDRKLYGEIVPKDDIGGDMLYGMLYHYNYVGSFVGLVIPLFTTLALFEKKLSMRISCIVFDLAAIFLLVGSSARSGAVAVAAALIVGIIVFARIIIKHWKAAVAVVAAAAIALVGANAVMDGRIFKRIPSIFEDAISLVAPAEGEQDLFSTLPVREIRQDDGVITLVSQVDELNIAFDTEEYEYKFTDKSGAEVKYKIEENGFCTIPDDRYSGITMEFYGSSETDGIYADFIMLHFGSDTQHALVFKLFGEKNIRQIDPNTGDIIITENAEAIGFKGKEKIGSSRGYIWSRTIPLLKNCLVYGYGPDTFAYEFPQNDYLAKYYSYAEGFNITVDKVHNLYLQILFSNGLIALLAFLFIVIWYLVDCFRLYALRKEYRETQIFGAAVMLAIVGYLAAGLFNDSVVSVAPVFWILLGVGFALNTINRRADKGIDNYAEEKVVKSREVSAQEQELLANAEARSAEIIALKEKLQQEKEQRIAEERARQVEELKRKTNNDLNALIEHLEQKKQELAEKQAAESSDNTDATEGDDFDEE